MIDIKFLRENPDVVRENIKKKFQDDKLPLVDEAIALDIRNREIKTEVEALRANRNKASKQIGALMGQGKREEAEEVKRAVAADGSKIDELSASVFVLERLTINQEFFDAMDARIQRKVDSLAMPHDFSADEAYLSLKAKATECAKEIRKLKADPKCSKVKLASYVELLKACVTRLRG